MENSLSPINQIKYAGTMCAYDLCTLHLENVDISRESSHISKVPCTHSMQNPTGPLSIFPSLYIIFYVTSIYHPSQLFPILETMGSFEALLPNST